MPLFPSTHTQNDTLSFDTTLDSAYDAFTLTYYLNSTYSVAASFANGVHTVLEQITNWTPGFYNVQGVVTDGTSRFTVEVGKVEILPDLSLLADSSSHVKKVLDAIEATILKTASKEQESYQVSGRQLKYRSMGELMQLRDKYRAEFASEQRAAKIKAGGVRGNIKVRFN